MAKVDENTKFKPGGFQVVKNLCAVLVNEFGDGL
jgi:hypothetical protein